MKQPLIVTGAMIFCMAAVLTINPYRFSLSVSVGPEGLDSAPQRVELAVDAREESVGASTAPAIEHATFTTAEITSGLSLVPSYRGGDISGVKIFGISPDSLHRRLGLENGDVVQSVNGIELTSPDQALRAYTQLRSARRFSIELERRGEPVTIEISVVQG